ncbi:UDP-N-acetylglucosamine--N-acetylmuramyl-(pentapeptide) pyrophosphoryl-undecaprenol N-acetylglucosamine transferase, partial [Candidatus Kaiserbacteria bacterium CG10_big_fil_rev_8_21_14_0_10_43_70]
MKIVLTGGGSGGHFYPLIAVAEQIHEVAKERKLLEPKLYYVGPKPFDAEALLAQAIEYKPTPAGKIRRNGGAIRNFFDIFKTSWGIVRATFQLFSLYPDVIFSKGGYAAFPTLFAARLLRIPVIIHESDATPGIVNKWSSSFARWIGIAHPDSAKGFSPKVQDKIALVGNPIRR